MLATNSGLGSEKDALKSPPKRPMSLRTPAVFVAFAKGLMRAMASSWRLMSTPEDAYVTGSLSMFTMPFLLQSLE